MKNLVCENCGWPRNKYLVDTKDDTVFFGCPNCGFGFEKKIVQVPGVTIGGIMNKCFENCKYATFCVTSNNEGQRSKGAYCSFGAGFELPDTVVCKICNQFRKGEEPSAEQKLEQVHSILKAHGYVHDADVVNAIKNTVE